ncbi:MAG: serine hydroxymethyltransferase [Alphaproteobacteria bacterium]|nr:serine hydroxymethyltransferase [Alphaproteobacteria bacterium]
MTNYGFTDLFTAPLQETDKDVFAAITHEYERQRDGIELIASENIVSRAVLQATGSVLTNKYAEGYPGRRYYGGCEHVDTVEDIARERAKKLFNCKFANVQPHSGAQANQETFMAVMQPGDCFMAMSLEEGGHLSHGASVNLSGKWFKPVHYGITKDTQTIDYDQAMQVAKQHKPKLIIAGGSAYSRIIDFSKFRAIADEVGALFMVDMAHFAGLVAAGLYPNPLDYADIATTTTHKTLRATRGGMILTNNPDLAKKINSAVFPGSQGGPLMHSIAGKAVGLGEALRPEFKIYSQAVLDNAQILAQEMLKGGFDLVSGGTDTHLLLVDLRKKGISGKQSEEALERAAITCNKNSVLNDPLPPLETSGIRLGTPAATSRGLDGDDFRLVGESIVKVLDALSQQKGGDSAIEQAVKQDILALCERRPIYPDVY